MSKGFAYGLPIRACSLQRLAFPGRALGCQVGQRFDGAGQAVTIEFIALLSAPWARSDAGLA